MPNAMEKENITALHKKGFQCYKENDAAHQIEDFAFNLKQSEEKIEGQRPLFISTGGGCYPRFSFFKNTPFEITDDGMDDKRVWIYLFKSKYKILKKYE